MVDNARDAGFILSFAVCVIGFIIWLIRLEGKVITANKIFELHKENCSMQKQNEKQEASNDRQEVIDSIGKIYDLMRDLSSKVDRILGWKEGPGGKQ